MIYVDQAVYRYKNMLMCHMIADSHEELLEMVDKIGVDRRWIQAEGTYREHFDICKSKRNIAVKNGAVEITNRQLAEKLKQKKLEL